MLKDVSSSIFFIFLHHYISKKIKRTVYTDDIEVTINTAQSI